MKNWLVKVVGGLVGFGVVAGCAGPGVGGRRTPEEIRGSAAVSGGEARPLVAGPLRLLHVNSDGRAVPRLSRVWVRGGAGDCRNGTPLDWDGAGGTVQVEKDELVCVESARPARISWHARGMPAEPASLVHQASLR
jgi:hypothetical protein